jgi:glutamine cyclotransferase
MAVWNDHLLISRGDYLTEFGSYFQVYDKYNLSLVYALDTLSGPQYAAEGIIVRNDTAYLAINNGFQFGLEVGRIGVIDLRARSYAGEIDLGPSGVNPDNIMMGGNRIYTLNNKDYGSSSISVLDPESRAVETIDMIAANSGCGTSALANGHVYFMEYTVGKLARFDVQNFQVLDTLPETGAYYGLTDDHISGQLIATETDFVSRGTAYILDYEGKIRKSFAVGVSPGSIALDIRSATGVHDNSDAMAISVYPNPVSSELILTSDVLMSTVQLLAGDGSLLFEEHLATQQSRINVASLPAGVYAVRGVSAGGNVEVHKFCKQ